MTPRLTKYMPVPKESKKDSESEIAGSKCNEIARGIKNKAVEIASTRFKIGAFHGKNQSCQTKDTNKTQSIKASWMPCVLGATTTGKDNRGPLAKRTKPNHHDDGRKLPMKNPMPRIRLGDVKDHFGAFQLAQQHRMKWVRLRTSTRIPKSCIIPWSRCHRKCEGTSRCFDDHSGEENT